MQGGHKNTYDSIAAFSATDFTRRPEEVRRADPGRSTATTTRSCPSTLSGKASAALVRNAELIVYPGAPHGITDTHKDRLNQDLLDFLRK
jgi:non-heme chloroperoxidase